MINAEEKVIALMPNDEAQPPSTASEQQLQAEATEIERRATQYVIRNDEDYANTAEFGREIKRQTAQITEFFKPMKEAAHKAHKQICDREKTMLEPLKKAEAIVKKAICDYQMVCERKKKEEEERLRMLAQREAEKKLEEAVEAEKRGDTAEADASLAEASMYSAANITVSGDTPRADGVSASVDYELVAIVDDLIPIASNGVTLRPVDEKAILKLIRQSKGSVVIPGVQYKEIRKVTIRR